MIKPENLAAWLTRTKPSRDNTKYVLIWVVSDDKEERLFSWDANSVLHSDGDWELHFAHTVLAMAQDECDEKNNTMSYRLEIEAGEKVLASKRIRAEPGGDDTDPLHIQQSTPTSANQQLIRVTEALLHIQVAMIKTFQDGYKNLLNDQAMQIKDMRKREEKSSELVFALLSAASGEETSSIVNDKAGEKLGELVEKLAPRMLEKLGLGDSTNTQ